MSSTELVTRVPSSAYPVLANCKSHEAMLWSFWEAFSHRIRGSMIRTNERGDRESTYRVRRLIPTRCVCPCGVTNSVDVPQ